MTLRHKQGDLVRIVKADAYPEYIGKTTTVLWVGPWRTGDTHPGGTRCIAGNDYLVVDPNDPDEYLACRESNLEAVCTESE